MATITGIAIATDLAVPWVAFKPVLSGIARNGSLLDLDGKVVGDEYRRRGTLAWGHLTSLD
jgi:hypothetical protein